MKSTPPSAGGHASSAPSLALPPVPPPHACPQEYNRAGSAAPSPRLTRAQRRKSLAVGQSLVLEPGALARAAAEEEEGEQQAGRRPAAGRRKSLAAAQAVPVHVAPPRMSAAQHGEGPGGVAAAAGPWASVADEVAALSAEICGGLDGVMEPSPEKGPRWGLLRCVQVQEPPPSPACSGARPRCRAACACSCPRACTAGWGLPLGLGWVQLAHAPASMCPWPASVAQGRRPLTSRQAAGELGRPQLLRAANGDEP